MSTIPSLALIPSGYKASKVYSVLPTDGSGDLTFTRTADTATRVNSAGLIESVLANVPRLDYYDSTCPRLLLEPQRTNLFKYSEQFDNAGWTKTNATITANTTATLDPSGYYGSDRLVENTANSIHRIEQTAILTSGQVYTQSVFAKDDGSGRFLRIFRASATFNVAVFNLTNGIINSQSGSNLISAKIEAYGNNWYRCSITFTAAFSNIASFIALQDGANDSYTGDGTSGLFIYGAQLELGAYATSYIPTVAAAVTRGADVASKTGISALIGQTEGTLFVEVDFSRTLQSEPILRHIFNLTDGTDANRVMIFVINADSTIRGFIESNNTLVVNTGISTSGITSAKIALAYKSGSIAMFVNGVLTVSSSSTFTFSSSLSQTNLGSRHTFVEELGDGVKQALLFPTRLTNTQLSELTTL